MEGIVTSILLIAAVGTGFLLVITGEGLIRSKNHLPWGLIWMASSTVYITAPAIIDTFAGISIFSDIEILHGQITRAKAYSSGLISIGFGLGFLLIATISRYLQDANPPAATIKRPHSKKGFAEGNYFIIYCGLTCIATFSLSHMVDGFDRYNSGATSAPIATLLRSLKVESLTLYGFFFGLHSYAKKILPELIVSIKTWSWPRKLSKAYLTAISCELVAIIFLVLKTGSRSMLAGCLITVFIGHIVHMRLSLRSVTYILLAAVIALPISVNILETIRIARSQSDFYKANPVHMARRLATSAAALPDVNSFIMNNRREEFNDVSFISAATCKEVLEGSEASLTRSQIRRLISCESKALVEYKSSSPFLANRYLSKLFLRINKDIHAGDQDWQSQFKEILGRDPESTSKGESINLAGDLFLRGGFSLALLGGIFLGLSYCCLSLTIGLLTSRMDNELMQSFAYILPLGLTSGRLFLPIDGQIWLLTTQLPKAIMICIFLGWVGHHLRVSALKHRSRTKRLSR